MIEKFNNPISPVDKEELSAESIDTEKNINETVEWIKEMEGECSEMKAEIIRSKEEIDRIESELQRLPNDAFDNNYRKLLLMEKMETQKHLDFVEKSLAATRKIITDARALLDSFVKLKSDFKELTKKTFN